MSEIITLGSGAAHIIVVHGAGTGARSVQRFGEVMLSRTPDARITIPDLYGAIEGDATNPIDAHRRTVLECTDKGDVHLIGHSMGGFVCLKVALSSPHVKSLTLIEPMAFGVLDPVLDRAALDEDRAVIARLLNDDGEAGTVTFIEYWGQTTWSDMPANARARILSLGSVLRQQGRAVSFDDTPLRAYEALGVPTLLIGGTNTRAPARRIIERLSTLAAVSDVQWVVDAKHLDVISNPLPFAEIAANHIANAR